MGSNPDCSPVGEDGQLDRVTLCQKVLLVDLWPLHIHLDVHVGGDLSCAFGLHHNGADVINQDSRARDAVTRLEVFEQVGRRVLQATNLQTHHSTD